MVKSYAVTTHNVLPLYFWCAGFHNRWNKKVEVRHPNLWVFVRKLKDEEGHCRVLVRAAVRGDNPPSRKRKYRLLQERISRLQDEYRQGQRAVNRYWAAVAHAVHNFA